MKIQFLMFNQVETLYPQQYNPFNLATIKATYYPSRVHSISMLIYLSYLRVLAPRMHYIHTLQIGFRSDFGWKIHWFCFEMRIQKSDRITLAQALFSLLPKNLYFFQHCDIDGKFALDPHFFFGSLALLYDFELECSIFGTIYGTLSFETAQPLHW